ncbi:MAG TPA: hypothetical protein VGN42_22395, partial [Pirellulales bacterium]|nr:hypothetical protein [Pirellulales bacterium]
MATNRPLMERRTKKPMSMSARKMIWTSAKRQPGLFNDPKTGSRFSLGESVIYFSPAEDLYRNWRPPTCIIVDGPYGVSGFPGDHRRVETLAEWYAPHIAAWSEHATGQTTLWFWGTELGWANVHPVFVRNGWEYRCCNTWDKGMSHVAGNTNTQTLRKLPVVTELCVQYVKAVTFGAGDEVLTMQAWLRREWQRSGLPLSASNSACGVKNAATRKYLTADHLWYYPPPDLFAKLAEYANR